MMTYTPAPSTQPMTRQRVITWCYVSAHPLPKRHHAPPGNTSPNDFQTPWQFRHPSFPLIIFKPPIGVGNFPSRVALTGIKMNVVVPNLELETPNGVCAIARRWLDEFGHVALATVVSTWGSSPVPIGGQLVVGPHGQFEGSVSGGCVEVEVITEAAEVLTGHRPK